MNVSTSSTDLNTSLDSSHINADQEDAAPKDHTISIGKQRINVGSFTQKVIEDINFLKDRMEHAKTLHSTDSEIFATYQKMLASRESVLKWFDEHHLLDPTVVDYNTH